MGGAPLCAIARGQGNLKQAEKIMNLSFTMLVIFGAGLMIVSEIFAHPILRMLGASEQMMPYTLPYLRIYLLGNLSFMVATGMMPFISAQGFPKVGMMAIAVGAISNILLDPLFIFVFGWGIQGAAVATVV